MNTSDPKPRWLFLNFRQASKLSDPVEVVLRLLKITFRMGIVVFRDIFFVFLQDQTWWS